MRRFLRIRPPERGASPFIDRFVEIMNWSRCGFRDLSERSGLHYKTLEGWRRPHKGGARPSQPKLDDFEAALNAMGFRLAIVRVGKGRQTGQKARNTHNLR